MKIRKKSPKPSGSGQPCYVIGYSSPAPSAAELQTWFDLEYGGPLKLQASEEAAPLIAAHGPWSARLQIALPQADADAWAERLDWRHTHAGVIPRPSVTPQQACDRVLFAARLARGLTLLTQGTAYDTITHTYLNPSDWTDRPLDRFRTADHVTVSQADSPDPRTDWFHTLGLSKFGLDELEVFRPVGLSSRPTLETFSRIADEMVRIGRSPNVGTTLPLPLLGFSIAVTRHRTAAPAGLSLPFREISWQEVRP
jgi:hypothetical protein